MADHRLGVRLGEIFGLALGEWSDPVGDILFVESLLRRVVSIGVAPLALKLLDVEPRPMTDDE